MAAFTSKTRIKRKAGDALKKKPKVIIRKPKTDSWSDLTRRPWFKSIKEFLTADSFAYGPLITDEDVQSDHFTLPDVKEVLKNLFLRSPTTVLKKAFVRTPQISTEDFDAGPKEGSDPVEEVGGESISEDNHSGTKGGGQVVHIHNDSDGGGEEEILQKNSEAGTGGHRVQTSSTTTPKKVGTSYPEENELGELRSGLSTGPPRSPLDPTVDTELTDPEELEDDEGQSHVRDAQLPLEFDTAGTVARRLLERLGGRFSEDLGIHVDDGDEEVERWFLAANLFSRSLPLSVSKQTYKELMALGVSKVTDFIKADEAKLSEIFERTGYTKYGQRVTAHFRKLAYQVEDEMRGRVTTLKQNAEPAELIRRLRALKGVKLSAVNSFMRELRGVWRFCDPDFDNRTKKAAVHIKLLRSMKPASVPEYVLKTFALEAGIDARDLEVACFKLGTLHEKDYANCPGGLECDILSSID